MPGYSRGICHHEDTGGRTVWQVYNTEVRLKFFVSVHLGIDHCWHLASGWLHVSDAFSGQEFPDFCVWTSVQISADSFLYSSSSVLNRIAWKRLTWRGRTKLIPSRNKSLSWSWRRWVDGNRKARLIRTFTATHLCCCIGFWHMWRKDSLTFFE